MEDFGVRVGKIGDEEENSVENFFLGEPPQRCPVEPTRVNFLRVDFERTLEELGYPIWLNRRKKGKKRSLGGVWRNIGGIRGSSTPSKRVGLNLLAPPPVLGPPFHIKYFPSDFYEKEELNMLV